MNKSEYLKAFRNEADTFLVAAERGLDAPVPACPEWTLRELVIHLGGAYANVGAVCRARAIEHADVRRVTDENETVRAGREAGRERAAGLIAWFRSQAADLEILLRDLDPDQPVFTCGPARQQGGFWHRRMAQETAVHRWDAESVHGQPRPIETDLAVDGLEEIADTLIASSRRQSKLAGTGERYLIRPTDTERAWLVRFDADRFEVEHSAGPADVTLGGTASDLLLYLWQRVPRECISIEGAPAVLDRYFELAPPV